jgi:hypothetical protein
MGFTTNTPVNLSSHYHFSIASQINIFTNSEMPQITYTHLTCIALNCLYALQR